MRIVITGGNGFLGQRLARTLLNQSNVKIDKITLVDVVKPTVSLDDSRVNNVQMDLRNPERLGDIITKETDAIFHLAAIVSSHAEEDPDLGYEINFLATRNLLEHCRVVNPKIRFIFSSSLAVFGGTLPELIMDDTAVTPLSTYGTQKAMCELLINDYSRRGFIDGLVLRLPTICIRPGVPNKAASSFVSSIIREPLKGEKTVCPVSENLLLWLSSPDTVINNFIYALTLTTFSKNDWHTVNLPGFTISVKEMLANLAEVKSNEILDKIEFKFDESINNIVASWPSKINNTKALKLGFKVDDNFKDVIQQFINKDL